MKKLVKLTSVVSLMLVLLMSVSGPVSATTMDTTEQTGLCDEAYNFQISPSSPEWAEMLLEDRVEACAVSLTEAKGMTTSALAETVLNYPFLVNIYAYGSIEDGIAIVGSYFPALTELLNREDASAVLSTFLENRTASKNVSDEDAFKMLSANDLLSYTTGKLELDSANEILPGMSSWSDKKTGSRTLEFIKDLTWADHGTTLSREQAIAVQYTQIYPSAVIIAPPSPSYNCHSYAFYSQSTSNRYWLQDPLDYLLDGSYVQTTNNGQGGLRAVYTYQNSIRLHSAITVFGGPRISVKSKWAENALFQHYADDCPYAITGTTIQYYQKA